MNRTQLKSLHSIFDTEFEVAVRCRGKFVAIDRIKKGSKELPISRWGWGSDFDAWLMPKIEGAIGRSQYLVVNRLLGYSKGRMVISELGGKDGAEVTLQEFFHSLRFADRGKLYVAYIKSATGVLRAVHAEWFGGGWFFFAYSASHGCFGDYRIVSRKFRHRARPSGS